MNPNRGQAIASAVRDYLTSNGLKQSQLTGDILAEIANRVLDHIDKQHAKQARLATEEEWIASLEKQPHLENVNIRRELAAAQFWCQNNRRQCTRRFFVNWLNNAVGRASIISPGGNEQKKEQFDVYTEPRGWKYSSHAQQSVYGGVDDETWKRICERGWFELGTLERRAIIAALTRQT